MFVTFSIWAFLFESIEQEDQAPHIQKERYVTKLQTSHNTMQKTRPLFLNLEIIYWISELGRQKWSPCIPQIQRRIHMEKWQTYSATSYLRSQGAVQDDKIQVEKLKKMLDSDYVSNVMTLI